jgi:hypothetical protein
MVLDAPVDQRPHERPVEEERYFIAFHLTDGTAVIRSYWLNTGELAHGIRLPHGFTQEIKRAVENLQNLTASRRGVRMAESTRGDTLSRFFYCIHPCYT